MTSPRAFLLYGLIVSFVHVGAAALGAVANWDTSTAAGYQAGSGTWGTDSFWSTNGTTLSPWVSGDTAVFQGRWTNPGTDTITISSALTIAHLTFGTTVTTNKWNLLGSALRLSANATFTVNVGSMASLANQVSGNFGVSKAGAGILAFDGLNAYTGMTTVQAGTLLVNGSINAVSVQAGARLGGGGSVGATTLANGATLGPGASLGLLSLASLSVAGGSNLAFEIHDAGRGRGVGYDSASVMGSLDLSAVTPANRIRLNLSTLAHPLNTVPGHAAVFPSGSNQSFTLFTYGALNLGSNPSIFDLFTLTTTGFTDPTGAAVSADYFRVVNDVDSSSLMLIYTAPIPEPSTYGIALGALGLALAAVRRRRPWSDANSGVPGGLQRAL